MKKPIIVKSPLAPKKYCINIFGTFWVRDDSWIDRYVINHEKIHTAQMRELLFIPFYLIYVLEWTVRLVKYRNRDRAYRNISFEREAYSNANDLDYLKLRKAYSWLRYLKSSQ